MFIEPKCELSANEVYTKFIDSEKKYGHLCTFSDQFSSKWKHLRVSTSLAAFWTYYECPQDVSRQLISRDFCPDATKALFLISNCASVKSYQIGDLLKLRADPNCQSSENADTPLHRLIRLCKVKAVRLLVNWGADVNRTNITGKTPLMTACDCIESKKQLLILSYLLKNKSLDLNAWDNEGNTAATLTVRASNIWTLRELLISGISIIIAAKKGRFFPAHDTDSLSCTSAYEIWQDSIDRQKIGESESSGTDGIQYLDKSTLYVDSVRRLKGDVCFLMIQRKASEEFHKINQGNDRLKTMQKVYKKGDRNLSPKKKESSKVKLLHTDSPKAASESKSETGDDNDFDSLSSCLEDVDMQRDKKEFDKRKREKKPHRHHRKKSDQRKDTDEERKSGRLPLTAQVDHERTNQLKNLRSSLRSSMRSSFRTPLPEGRDKSGKSDRRGCSLPPPPSPFEIKAPKTVTFKEDLNSYESLGQWF